MAPNTDYGSSGDGDRPEGDRIVETKMGHEIPRKTNDLFASASSDARVLNRAGDEFDPPASDLDSRVSSP